MSARSPPVRSCSPGSTTLPPQALPLFLISGGASALVEVLREGATLHDLQALTREALAQDIAIGELNARRIGISRIKGGRLAARLGGRPGRALFISDVPQDDPAVIGSGLIGPASEGADRIARRVVASSRAGGGGGGRARARARPERAAAGTALRRQRDAPRRALRARAAACRRPRCACGAGSRPWRCRRSPGAAAATSTWRSPPRA